jgi:hypothetical protein
MITAQNQNTITFILLGECQVVCRFSYKAGLITLGVSQQQTVFDLFGFYKSNDCHPLAII